ncbi:hypothetical protein CMI49_01970 [Candidatus Pacearchaeota archaeon]|jgi:hypothetical protein|nr:hypothetical protein [Candidatus Pacearchaeota archaeon]|tara:strand:+ start:172 stop:2157 length:1986 start_codon:yes stop_codon:yes gene_type:complete
MNKLKFLIITFFLLTGCKANIKNNVEVKDIVLRKVPAYNLSNEAICKVLKQVDLPSLIKETKKRGLNCRNTDKPLVNWETPLSKNNFVYERQYQKKYKVIIPEYQKNKIKSIYGTPQESLKFYKFYNQNFENHMLSQDWRQFYCNEWLLDLQWVDNAGTKNLDGSLAWLAGTERDSFVICEDMMLRLSLMGLFSSKRSKIFQNIIENWIRNDAPKKNSTNKDHVNIQYVFFINGAFNGVELLHQNFNWDENKYKKYAKWMKSRTLEFYPIEKGYKSSIKKCLSVIRKVSDRSNECQNQATLTAQATLRAGIWLKDKEFIDQAFLTFHKYMTGIRNDGSNISDGSRSCVAANYNIWASAYMENFVYLWSLIGSPLWEHRSLGMGTPSESVKYSLSLFENLDLINPHTLENGKNYNNCSPNKNNRKQIKMRERYTKIYFAPYFFQIKNIDPVEFVGGKNYLQSNDYLFDGGNFEISYLYHHPEKARKAENLYISLKGKYIKNNTDLINNGLKNKKRGILKEYDTVIQLFALHKDDEYKYPIFIAIKKYNFIDILLPRLSIKNGDPWNLDKNIMKFCSKKSTTDESYIINLNQISNETEIKCILSSFTFEESNIFLKSYNELIKNVNIIFQDSIKESNDEHEKRLLKKSLDWLNLNQFKVLTMN